MKINDHKTNNYVFDYTDEGTSIRENVCHNENFMLIVVVIVRWLRFSEGWVFIVQNTSLLSGICLFNFTSYIQFTVFSFTLIRNEISWFTISTLSSYCIIMFMMTGIFSSRKKRGIGGFFIEKIFLLLVNFMKVS